ncbi:MAG TPA: hypothetical protein DCQ29_08345 [Chitinophagaceae bacterium]|nr:hypothetical protein [Chitinophagaceae bacterium]
MKKLFQFQALLLLILVVFSCKKSNKEASAPQTPAVNELAQLEPYNFVLGTHAISGSYQFTTDNKLVEQAKRVREMGSNILKITLGKNSADIYGIQEATRSTTTLALFTNNLPYRTVCDMDFRYIFFWVHTLTNIEWRNGISAANEQILYNEMYSFASFILTRYNNSGKTFFIGNWEGDWLLIPNYDRTVTPSPESIANMTKWFQIRQRAIDDAKRASNAQNVNLYHYIEANLVLKGMNGEPCVARSVLPNVDVDFVSYSSYEAIKDKTYAQKKTELEGIFNYLEAQLRPKAGLPFARRVFIGEYGYQANASVPQSFQKQYDETKEIMRISFELNLPFALHWQMYNNEYENGVSKQMSLINESGAKTRQYTLHNSFYKAMNTYLKDEMKKNNRYPTTDQYRTKAIQVLGTL